MGERVQEMNPVDIGERVQEMNSDDMGERVNEMNQDDMGERLTDMNPDGMGESLPEMNPDELMLNYDRVDENVEVAHQSHTMPPQEVIETIIDAAGSRNYTRVIHLIDHCVDLPVQYIDYKGNNLLHMVLYTYIRAYLTEDSDEIIREYHGTHKDELLQCVMKLVKASVDVNHPNKDKQTPIFIAARYGLHNIVVYLIDHGVDVHYIDKNQNNVLHLVFESYTSIYEYHKIDRGESLHCIIKLVEAGVDISHMVKDEETLIIKMENKKGWYKIISPIHHHVHIHKTDKRQNNTLNVVFENYISSYRTNNRDEISRRQIEFVEIPISSAVICKLYKVLMNVFVPDAHVDYVLTNDQGIAYHVIYNRHDINKEDESQYTRDFIQVVRTLKNMRVDVNKPYIDGNTPLFKIVSNQTPTDLLKRSNILFRLQYNLITALVFDGCNVNHQNKDGQTPLMYYIRHLVDIRILKLVIPLSDVRLTDNNGDTACSYCVQYYILNYTNLFKLYPLSELMSPINGVKLFHQILTCKRLELLHYYMRSQLIVKGVTTEEENMLHLLARVKYDYSQDKFNWLFNKKLDINHRCSKTNTPIMIAALLLNSKYLELFTRHPRIRINAQNNQGHTALHLCIIGFTTLKDGLNKRQQNDIVEDYCSHKYLMYMECVDILLAVGIDVNAQDGKGRTALMMAAMKNDRFLIRKLLNAGAIVNCGGKSALHHLYIYESVFDITFKSLVAAVDNMLLNVPCIDGNTLIQATLCFPRWWDPHTAVSFIKYLVGENCCLQSLVTSSPESSYNQIDMRELNSQKRNELRKLLYLSGAPENQIVGTLNFEKEDTNVERGVNIQVEDRNDQEVGFYLRHQQIFTHYCCNISLKSQCRRIIRQKLGLGIKEKVMDLDLPRELNDFLLLKDVLRSKAYYIDNIDDGCNDFDDDDGYGGYDIVKDNDNDHSQYNYQYFTLNTDDELKDEFSKTGKYPNGEHADTHL